MVKVGVVGCGRIAERHLGAYRRLGVPVAVTDQIAEAAKQLGQRFGVTAVPRVQDILSDDSLDAIDICVPTPAHAELVQAALHANKHVFCEKPLCATVDEARLIQQALSGSGKQIMVGYLYRFHPAYQFVKEILSSGVLGAPHLAIFRLGGRGNTRAWKHEVTTGGGAMLEMLVHMLDLAEWLLGPLEDPRLLAREVLLPERRISSEYVLATAEDYVVARFKAGNAEILCESDLVTPSYMNYTEVHGDNGSLLTSILSYLPTVLYCKEARGIYDIGNHVRNFPQVDLFELELAHFIESIEGIPTDGAVQESMRLISLVDSLRDAGR